MKKLLYAKMFLPVMLTVVALLLVIIIVSKKMLRKEDVSVNEHAKQTLIQQYPELSNPQHYAFITQELGHHLGTIYPKYDPRYWTENDKEVFEILVCLTTYDIAIISNLYFTVVAKGRDFRQDIIKLLDKKYYEQIKHLLQ
jgi:hypothetical protein